MKRRVHFDNEGEEPSSRMTRLTDAMIKAMHASPDKENECFAIVMVTDSETKEAGIVMHGYETTMVAVEDIFVHLRVILRSIGKDIMLVPFEKPIGRDS